MLTVIGHTSKLDKLLASNYKRTNFLADCSRFFRVQLEVHFNMSFRVLTPIHIVLVLVVAVTTQAETSTETRESCSQLEGWLLAGLESLRSLGFPPAKYRSAAASRVSGSIGEPERANAAWRSETCISGCSRSLRL